jgi:hypothetical protein
LRYSSPVFLSGATSQTRLRPERRLRHPPKNLKRTRHGAFSTAHNDLTGQITFTAISPAIHGDARLIVRLVGKKLDCYVNIDDFLDTVDNMSSRRSLVGYKFDDGSIVRQEWVISDASRLA